jgi:uncharacterized membrane protein (UPF0127 family)
MTVFPLRTVLLAFGIVFFAAPAPAPAQTANLQKIDIASKSGTHSFLVEIAANDEQRARGLMYRKDLPEGRGMLFDFKREQDVGFWMKNTYIPLDMIFIRGDGTVRRIAANTEPLSERSVPAGGPVRYVLEVIGGTAAKLGIEPGDKVTGAPLR